jgi:hypothetical protein
MTANHPFLDNARFIGCCVFIARTDGRADREGTPQWAQLDAQAAL